MINLHKTSLAMLAIGVSSASAAIEVVHLYQLGETENSGNSFMAQDSVSGSHFGPAFSDPVSGITVGDTPISSSVRYVSFEPNDFQFGADFSGLATDNYAIEFWARTTNLSQDAGILSTANGTENGLGFGVVGGNWTAGFLADSPASGSVSDILGESFGVSAIQSGAWTQLAYIRENGTSSFYVDKTLVGTSLTAPVHDDGLLAVFSGGSEILTADLDNIRIFTFDPSTDNAFGALTTAVPEPSSFALIGGLLAIALVRFRRQRT